MGAPVTAENLLEKVASFTAGSGVNQVTASCFAVGVAARRRYEILLEGPEGPDGRERAIFDVPRGVDPHPLLERAAELFADSLAMSRR